MPTAARMIAAVIFALIGYLVAGEVKPLLPEGQPTNYLLPVSVIIPALCAWRIMGRLMGRGYVSAINTGIYASACGVVFCLLAFALGEMLKRSMRKQYDGPFEAITGMFGIVFDYGLLLVNPTILGYLLVGGAVTGVISEWAYKRWG